MGVSVWLYKVYAFVISAAMAGLAGTLFAYSEQYISPNTYSFELTILFLLAVTMGGRKSPGGDPWGIDRGSVAQLPFAILNWSACLRRWSAVGAFSCRWHSNAPRWPCRAGARLPCP